jgi:hypothetical protein
LASFVDPRQSFGPDKIIPPSILANAKVGLVVVRFWARARFLITRCRVWQSLQFSRPVFCFPGEWARVWWLLVVRMGVCFSTSGPRFPG